mmetsp:Transcript_25495/g.45239  ORF Transcript_25495/g.45239 Transcript_25495/m.45239 type:complete len:338 (-) Transcript_25495:3-1016(-)
MNSELVCPSSFWKATDHGLTTRGLPHVLKLRRGVLKVLSLARLLRAIHILANLPVYAFNETRDSNAAAGNKFDACGHFSACFRSIDQAAKGAPHSRQVHFADLVSSKPSPDLTRRVLRSCQKHQAAREPVKAMSGVQDNPSLYNALLLKQRYQGVESVAAARVDWQRARLANHQELLRLYDDSDWTSVQHWILATSDCAVHNALPIPQNVSGEHALPVHGDSTSLDGSLVVVPRESQELASADLQQTATKPALLHESCEVKVIGLDVAQPVLESVGHMLRTSCSLTAVVCTSSLARPSSGLASLWHRRYLTSSVGLAILITLTSGGFRSLGHWRPLA